MLKTNESTVLPPSGLTQSSSVHLPHVAHADDTDHCVPHLEETATIDSFERSIRTISDHYSPEKAFNPWQVTVVLKRRVCRVREKSETCRLAKNTSSRTRQNAGPHHAFFGAKTSHHRPKSIPTITTKPVFSLQCPPTNRPPNHKNASKVQGPAPCAREHLPRSSGP